MLNQTVLVGRIVKDIEVKETENEKKVTNIKIAIPRSYKNANGEYDTDFIDIVLWNGIAESTAEYCRKGDLIGVKGRLQSNNNKMEVVAEKVTFLSNSKDKKNDDYENDYEKSIS